VSRSLSATTAAGALALVALAAPIAALALRAESSVQPATVLVSRADGAGRGGDANSLTPSISADGRYVAFASRARNLDPAARSGNLQVYVRDLVAGKTTLASRADGAEGPVADGFSAEPSISADGRYVAFRSNAENLSAEGVAFNDVFVRDLVAATTELASRAPGGAAADGDSGAPSLSADGRHVAFESQADNLSGDDADGNSTDVFVRDLDTGVTELVSRVDGPGGTGGDDLSFEPSISADGRYVAFESRAQLSADDVDDPSFPDDVFVRDRVAGGTILVSRASGVDGAPSEVESAEPAISADGRHVAFRSEGKLAGRQEGFEPDVFVRDLDTATTELVTVGEGPTAGRPFRYPAISADGRYVAFQSGGNGITDVDVRGRIDVFVRDMRQGVTVLASRASGSSGVPADGPSFNASISADGSYVAFDSRATNLSGADGEGISDVFRRRPVYRKERPLPKCAGRTVTITGTARRDTIKGTKRSDVILALGGADRIRGLTGGDTICAGAGTDRVDAGPEGGHGGRDLVLGGPGPDRLTLGPELGTLRGQGGNDLLIGSRGGDTLQGGRGNDILRGGPNPHFNNDFLFGGPGNDLLIGGPGPDQASGGPGRDRIVPPSDQV
jgi:Tol biopolymer transport system component